jgi:hypothetical protein
MLVPTPVLVALDPDAFDTLAPWLIMKVDDPMPSNLMHPVCQFLINVIERQVSMFSSSATASSSRFFVALGGCE